MNGLIAWWARNSVAANLLMLGILVAGLLSYFQMEREMDPKVNFNGMTIQAAWPGAGPQEVEEQIISRIEEALSDLDNIDFIRSFSGEGSGQIWMRAFETVDFAQFQSEVKQRVDSISTFPADMEPVQIQRWTNDNPYMRLRLSGDIPEKELKHLADAMRKEILALDHISLVTLFGTREEEVSIEVSPAALERYNLTFQEVSNAISFNSLNLSSGTIRTDAGQIKLATRELADSEEELGDIIVRQTLDGGTIRVRDVANVVDGFVDNELLATVNGKPTVLINILNSEVMQIQKASEGIRDYMEKRRKSLPEGVELEIWDDGAVSFNSNLKLLLNSAGVGLLLVMVVLFLTLRPVVAIWVSIGIATAYLGAFVFLPTIGISINFISMFSFLLVLGIVVDDAIIVGENIHSESHKTGGGVTGAILGAQLVAKPVIFGVFTTIIAFLPWIFITGGTSEFTRNITWVVVCALIFSLVEALFILPAHLAKMKPRDDLGGFGRVQKMVADGIVVMAEKYYRPIATWASEQRWLVTMTMVAIYLIFSSGMLGAGYIKFQFDPDIEADEINIQVNMPDGTPYSRAEQILAQMQAAQEQLEREVAEEQAELGTNIELIEAWYTRARADDILAIVKLARNEDRPIKADGTSYTAKEAAVRLRELIGDIPDAEEVTVSYQRNNPDPGIQFAIGHPDLDTLQAASNDLMEQLRTYENVIDVRDNLQGVSEEARLVLKPGARKLGLTLQEVSRQVRQAYFGAEPMRLPRGGEDVRIKVRFPKDVRKDPESLEQFRIRTPDNQWVPLSAIVDIKFAPGINAILHWDRKRATVISADLKENDSKAIFEDLKENFWDDWDARYPGVNRDPIGQAQGEARFFAQLLSLYVIAFFAMYAMLAIAFKSYAQPIMIMTAIPFAYIGALMGHAITGTPLTFFSFFGIAAAAGVVVNDNLVMVDYCNKLRNEQGMDAKDAMVEAGVRRFRPIFLTTLTTVIGLLPMLLERSQEAAFLKPMVLALSSGVLFDFFVTLLLVPALYRVGGDIKRVGGKYIRWQFGNYLNLITGRNREERGTAE